MEKEIYIQMDQVEDIHWWFVGRRIIIRHLLKLLNLPKKIRILDAGCGTGGNVLFLSEFGNVTGIELDDGAAEIARNKKLGSILRGSLPNNMPFLHQTFDLIILLDVLEHIDNDVESLKNLNSLLKMNGYLILTVPAFSFLWSQHDEQHHHFRRYRVSKLRHVVENAGFNVVYISYYNFFLFPIITALRIFGRFFPSKAIGANVRLPSLIINKILLTIFSSERHFLGRFFIPLGVSILAVARKM